MRQFNESQKKNDSVETAVYKDSSILGQEYQVKNKNWDGLGVTDEKSDYEGWDGGDWESYFAKIRISDGQAAAEAELNRMTQAGLIPNNMVAMAAIGARGGRMGH